MVGLLCLIFARITATIVTNFPLGAEGAVASRVGLTTRNANCVEQSLARIGTKLSNQLSHVDRRH
jgi:hypothetical protein